MLNQFKNLSCCEEFEIQCALMGISKIDVLTVIGYKIDDYYFFVSKDGIFNLFDLDGNHIENPGVLKYLTCDYIPVDIAKCIIPNSVTSIGWDAFAYCKSLKEITIPNSVTRIGWDVFYGCTSLKEVIFKGKTLDEVKQMDNFPFGIGDETYLNLVNFF